MITNIIKNLCDNIVCVYSKKDDNVYYDGKFEPVMFKHKYSSSPNDTIRLKNNGIILPIGDLSVKYKCPTCLSENSILLRKFMVKDTIGCPRCRENGEKRDRQSKYMTTSFTEFGKVVSKNTCGVDHSGRLSGSHIKFKSLTSGELIKMSLLSFEEESDVLKINYFNRVPTVEEFNKIRNKIKIDDLDMDKIQYYPYVLTGGSHKYAPKILDEYGKLHLLYYVKYKCDSCGKEFDGRSVKKRASQYKILCKDCCLCNKTFKVRYTKNIKGSDIRYQSKPELDLIEYCRRNSILIENGPTIDYIFNGSKFRYIVDFKIKNMLIEIKDDHVWHKNELKSGKWTAKEGAAKEYCKNNNLEYKLVMKSDVKSLKDLILRYFWSLK